MELVVKDFGTGHKKIVLLHGWGLGSQVFLPLAGKLSTLYQVRLIDLPGYGDNSAVASQVMEFADYVDLIAPYIPKGGLLVGWSLGGLVAQQLDLIRPGLVAKLALVCSSPFFPAQDPWPGIELDVLEMFQRELEQDYQKLVQRFLGIQAMGSESAKQDMKRLKQLLSRSRQPSQESLALGLQYLKEVDLREALGKSSVPILRIFGAKDSLVPQQHLPLLEKMCPGSQKIVMPRASHAPFISHESQFIQHLCEFYAP